jgi:hypothetical protein
MSTQDSGDNLGHDLRVSPDADQQLLVSVSVHVPASLAVSPDMAGQLLTQVIRAFPTHHAALRANPRFGAAQQTLDAAMVALGYNGNSSDDSDDQLDDDGGIQPVGMVVMSNQYPAPQYPDGFVLGWHHPPPLPTPYPLCCDCADGQCVAAGTAQDQAVDGACAEFLRAEVVLAMTAGEGNGGYQDTTRDANNKQRYRCYQAVARLLDYTYRQQLPNCVVSSIRSIWPSPDGIYTGYRAPDEYTSSSNDSNDDY